ncbi:NADH-quinone oxidoreductase subunit C [Rubellicoccus peritrichatus]|uniref:NADH-quinone oxidoreductase subunit C n=1 Tax=Rubellicoccus peritrichatus TaxID=3080537 RepID=A0AAQ3L689_9BACT|nr:NADH-quinone oxidoreductase subunit C [Puniceicoccus sp. CR14]WOO39477.1 NADH-quinone oxidoreductase subunit C [Puniceicoccus sp. CR14]
MDAILTAKLLERFPFAEERASLDHPAIKVPADKLVEVCQVLMDEFGYSMLTDSTAIDWGEEVSPRFTGIYHLFKVSGGDWIRIAADCSDDAEPVLPSLVELFPIANWQERETYDMFGIRYENHPDMRRILMWDDYPYHPLRKEFPLAGHETELPAADVAKASGAKVIPAPMMGGPFHAPQTGEMSDREPRAADQSWTEKNEKPETVKD